MERELAVARLAALRAGAMLIKLQPQAQKINQKRKDFLTNADLRSEALIMKRLKSAFPDDYFYGEEGGGDKKTVGRQWYVDPLDGTVNFFWQEQWYWGVSIAFVFNGHTRVAVVYLPAAGYIFWAVRGGYAYMAEVVNGKIGPRKRLHVSRNSNPAESQVWTDWIKGTPSLVHRLFRKLGKSVLYPQIRLCASASLMDVARGRIDGYIIARPGPEDIAAGGLIVECAGGSVTDVKGDPWTPLSPSIAATNGKIHQRIVQAIR